MKRFVTEYANYRISDITKNKLMREDIKREAVEKIGRIIKRCERGLLSHDEAIWAILNTFKEQEEIL
jgi:hypothetical protein